jgi:hypothetical protein
MSVCSLSEAVAVSLSMASTAVYCGFLHLGCPLWWEDGSVIYSYNSFWVLPEQSLSGPSPSILSDLGLPQPGGPGPHIYIPQEQVGPEQSRIKQSYITTDGQSVSQYAMVPSPLWACDQTLYPIWMLLSENFFLVSVGRPLWWEFGSVICVFVVICLYEHQICTFHVFKQLNDV